MIYHLQIQELAMDFRKASIEQFSFKEIKKFLREIRRVYNNLFLCEQEEAVELWIGFSERWGFVVDTYHYHNFTPLIPLKSYFIESKNEVMNLYGELYRECYSHKIHLGDFHDELREMPHLFEEEEEDFYKEEIKAQNDSYSLSKVLDFTNLLHDIELPF